MQRVHLRPHSAQEALSRLDTVTRWSLCGVRPVHALRASGLQRPQGKAQASRTSGQHQLSTHALRAKLQDPLLPLEHLPSSFLDRRLVERPTHHLRNVCEDRVPPYGQMQKKDQHRWDTAALPRPPRSCRVQVRSAGQEPNVARST